MKTCRKCQKTIPVTATVNGRLRNFQNRKFCLDCSPFGTHNTRDIRFQRKNRIGVQRVNQDAVRLFRERKKQKMIDYKGGKCLVCGYNRCNDALHFHHIDPSTKSFEICRRPSWGFDRLKPELDKCALLCSNCHYEVHDGLVDISKLVIGDGVEPPSSPCLGDALSH